jgi:hypothetical protein
MVPVVLSYCIFYTNCLKKRNKLIHIYKDAFIINYKYEYE